MSKQNTPNPFGNVSVNRVYETIGRLYIQLSVANEQAQEMSSQLAESNARLSQLEDLINQNNIEGMLKQAQAAAKK